ncbi:MULTISPECIES: LuxR C-terminal-related transcriptional regulator [unclassified Mycobacterium]|uniref:LuxR C-terminal-related transcriptional regulator n=1 Tax=unclassified Mycobacterium TaxID=2642494 RepID=UPI0029C61364|nr:MULTISPECIES: LuxR C-terminal-related transcriptional regulator [unclassified Mycobacterium]
MVDRWPLTGRAEELRVISEALSDDDHQGMVIAGQAGVGKTRLARTAADAAAKAGWSVHRIAGTTTGQPVTLGAFARWADATDGSPLMLARKVFAGLKADAGDAQLLLFVDDAHLLDDMSAMIVHQLLLQNTASVIATIRSGESAPDAVTALWKDGLLRRLELQPLSHDECGELLETVLDGPVSATCVDRMWTLSRGNVLFLHHLVEHERDSGRLASVDGEWRWSGTHSVSPSLVELVETQIGAVPDDVREVVDLVAIAEPIDQALLSSIADPQAIEAAEHLGLITASADTVFVGHPLYGEIRLSQCGPIRLRRLRGRVAAAMATSGMADPLRLGLLWLESDLPPDVAILSTAAFMSASLVDLELADRLARAVVDADPSPSSKLLLAHILYIQEKGQEAEELLDALGADELVAPGFVDGVILRAANLLFPLRNPDAARAVIDDAVQLGDEARNQALLTFRAVGEAMAADPATAVETMCSVAYDQLDSYGRVLGYAAETIALGDLGLTARATERASAGYRELTESPQESFHASGLAEFHAYALLAAGCVDDAVVIAEQGHRQYAELPGMSRSMAIAALGMAALGSGDLNTARRQFDSARESFGDYGEVAGLYYRFRILHTEVLARSGLRDAAIASLETTRQSRHPSYEYVESGYLLANAWVAAVSGRVTEARAFSRQAAEFARSHGQLAREVLALQAAVQFGDGSAVERLTELATAVEGPRAPLAARYAHAIATDDAAALEAVSRDFEAMGDALAAVDAAAQASTSHRLAGRRGSALTSSARAYLLANDCGGAVSPALAAARVPLPFTRREHEIAKLLSRGLSNKDIAEATSLSIRTVEGHIYQASAKAGVTSRSELSALVQQYNEPEPASKG